MLRFGLFGIPVTIRPSFLLIAVLLGFNSGSLTRIIVWVGVVFVSIVVHELGHALVARSFGSEVEIELNAIGGLTSWTLDPAELGPGRRAFVAGSGSATGLLFGGLVWLAAVTTGPHSGDVGYTLTIIIWVNVFWGLLNWLPIRPLDGGHLLLALLEKTMPSRSDVVARYVFIATAAAGTFFAFRYGFLFAALLAGWLLVSELFGGPGSGEPVGLPAMTFDDEPDDVPSSDGEVPGNEATESEQLD
jgi:membrane-associated protease RseP (regulator of RpoE activity)